jgi:hypothetical protein
MTSMPGNPANPRTHYERCRRPSTLFGVLGGAERTVPNEGNPRAPSPLRGLDARTGGATARPASVNSLSRCWFLVMHAKGPAR